MAETTPEIISFTRSSDAVYGKGSTAFMKYYDTGSSKWERVSGSGSPYVTIKDSIGISVTGSSNTRFAITGSTVTVPVSGSVYITDSSGVANRVADNKLRVSAMPYAYDIAEGNISNHTQFTKLGYVTTVVNVEQDIWSKGGKYVFPTATGSMIVQSTSTLDHSTGSGIRTLKIGYLDGNYVSKSETISMNGTTQVATTNTDIFRVNSIRAVTTGTGLKAAGTIQVSGSSSANVYRILNIGQTRGRSLIYTVPSGSTVYITGMNLSSSATASGHFGTFTMRSNFDDVNYNKTDFMEPWFEIALQDLALHFPFDTPVKIPQTCDVVGSVIGEASNSNLTCYGSWRGWIETG